MTEEYKPIHGDEVDICIIARNIAIDIVQYALEKHGYELCGMAQLKSKSSGIGIEVDLGKAYSVYDWLESEKKRKARYAAFLASQASGSSTT